MKRFIFLCLALWQISGQADPPELKYRFEQLTVSATVNGKIAGPFGVDAEAMFVTLTESFAKKLGLEPKQGIQASLQAIQPPAEGWYATVDSLEVNGVVVEKVQVAVVPDSRVKGQGNLGRSFLSRLQGARRKGN